MDKFQEEAAAEVAEAVVDVIDKSVLSSEYELQDHLWYADLLYRRQHFDHADLWLYSCSVLHGFPKTNR